MTDLRVGLVLSGGGAKGAYQVGVVKALSELGAQVDAVAGASIGALNGAILASSRSLDEGARRLDEVWRLLAETSPLSVEIPNYIGFLMSAGLHLNGLGYIDDLVRLAARPELSNRLPDWLRKLVNAGEKLSSTGVFSDGQLHRLMDEYLDQDALANGLPLYVSMFKSRGGLTDLLSCVTSELGFTDSPPSEFMHVQALPTNEQREALLASAAIPLLFAPKRINDTLYTDGGQGGWAKMQGNTPITPLLQAGYKTIIVNHLSDGSLWSRQDFPEATILEIRPGTSIDRSGGAKDLLGFDASKIPSWTLQGYEDTMRCVGRVMSASKARNEWKVSEAALRDSEKRLIQTDAEMEAALRRVCPTPSQGASLA